MCGENVYSVHMNFCIKELYDIRWKMMKSSHNAFINLILLTFLIIFTYIGGIIYFPVIFSFYPVLQSTLSTLFQYEQREQNH